MFYLSMGQESMKNKSFLLEVVYVNYFVTAMNI
jgi:hypothetical protein